MSKTFELTLNNKTISFTIDVYQDESLTELCAEAKMSEENKENWASNYFPDIPKKQIYKVQQDLDNLYTQIEAKLTDYIKTTYPDMDLDWETTRYQELFILDNNFKMSVMINA